MGKLLREIGAQLNSWEWYSSTMTPLLISKNESGWNLLNSSSLGIVDRNCERNLFGILFQTWTRKKELYITLSHGENFPCISFQFFIQLYLNWYQITSPPNSIFIHVVFFSSEPLDAPRKYAPRQKQHKRQIFIERK